MSQTQALLLAQAFASCFMCGLIWFVQVVHYPLFAMISGGPSNAYAEAHQRRTTLVVGPPMLVEAATAGLLAWRTPDQVPQWLALTGLGLVAAIWLCTAFVQVPLHARLAREGHSRSIVRALVLTNWGRTALWTARAAVAGWMLTAV